MRFRTVLLAGLASALVSAAAHAGTVSFDFRTAPSDLAGDITQPDFQYTASGLTATLTGSNQLQYTAPYGIGVVGGYRPSRIDAG